MQNPRSNFKQVLLEAADSLSLVAPAKHVQPEQVEFFKREAQASGFTVLAGQHLFSKHGAFAGLDEQRLTDLQMAIDHPKAKAIFAARGGYGTTKILSGLNWKLFKKNPKTIVGFSDITALHCAVNRHLNVASLHSPMPLNIGLTENHFQLNEVFDALCGKALKHEYKGHECDRDGVVSGTVIGGNLSVLAHLAGTADFPDVEGKILLLEEVGESTYHVDRMMTQLGRLGVFDKIAGLIFGGFTQIEDRGAWFDISLEQVLFEHVKHKHYPVSFNAPYGHFDANRPIWFGVETRLQVSGEQTVIHQSGKE